MAEDITVNLISPDIDGGKTLRVLQNILSNGKFIAKEGKLSPELNSVVHCH